MPGVHRESKRVVPGKLSLPDGALPHSPLVALPPGPCQEVQPPWTPTLR